MNIIFYKNYVDNFKLQYIAYIQYMATFLARPGCLLDVLNIRAVVTNKTTKQQNRVKTEKNRHPSIDRPL